MEVRRQPGGDLNDISDAAAKIANNAARIAAIFVYFEYRGTEICVEAMNNAIEVARWHLYQFKTVFGMAPKSSTYDYAVKLHRWLIKQHAQHTEERSYKRSTLECFGPNCLRGPRNRSKFEAATEYLIELRFLTRRLEPLRFEPDMKYVYWGMDFAKSNRYQELPVINMD